MSSGYWVLMASSLPAFVVSHAAAFLFALHGACAHVHMCAHTPSNTHSHRLGYIIIAFLLIHGIGWKHIDKYLEYLPIEIVKLNWAELRQMRRSKLNKQSSLLGDSTMVIRVSCELPYIIYGCAVGCLQLNKPTVHWLGTLREAVS